MAYWPSALSNRLERDRPFQTASINSRFAFTYGKVDVRIALPSDQALKTVIILIPETEQLRGDRVNGEIELLADIQFDERWLFSRLAYDGNFGAHQTYRALKGFHTYSLEWTEKAMLFLQNGVVKREFNLDRVLEGYDKRGEPFDTNFFLAIRLQVCKTCTCRFNMITRGLFIST